MYCSYLRCYLWVDTVKREILYYFCNFLWVLKYFKTKNLKIKKRFICDLWVMLQTFSQLFLSTGTSEWETILKNTLSLIAASWSWLLDYISSKLAPPPLFLFFYFFIHVTQSGQVAVSVFKSSPFMRLDQDELKSPDLPLWALHVILHDFLQQFYFGLSKLSKRGFKPFTSLTWFILAFGFSI